MKSNLRLNEKYIVIIGICLILASMIYTYSFINNTNIKIQEKNSVYFEKGNPKFNNLKTSQITGKIHINNNWSVAKSAGIVSGSGTYSDPYIIEDLVIDGNFSGYCLWIENSSKYLRIENCTVYNSGSHYGGWGWGWGGGLVLSNTSNSIVINNSVFNNSRGLFLENSNNNTISNNTINNNYVGGIIIDESNNNTISSNTINNQDDCILLKESYMNNLFGNIIYGYGIRISGSLDHLNSHNIDTTNHVNNKSIYYYANKINLKPTNFSNAGQVILVNCNDSLISNINVSQVSIGISIYYSNNNNITNNIANYNDYGIFISKSDNNIISGNIASYNTLGIELRETNTNNNITGNEVNYNSLIGIRVYENQGTNSIQGNSVSYNGVGIEINTCFNHILSENIINDNGYGLDIKSSVDTKILRNTVNNNTGGISLRDGDYNNITGNIITYNGDSGIYSFESDNNIISVNIVKYNGEDGIHIHGRSDNTFILGNTASNNGGNGILIGNSVWESSWSEYINNFNTISGNNVSFNFKSGIHIEGSSYNKITGNIANFNDYCGILLRTSESNEIMGNTANNNAYGLFLIRSCNNKISNNLLTNNFNADYSDIDPCESEERSLEYFPLILGIVLIAIGVSLLVIFKNRQISKKIPNKLDL